MSNSVRYKQDPKTGKWCLYKKKMVYVGKLSWVLESANFETKALAKQHAIALGFEDTE